jgi:type IV secretion system protein VirD4
MTRFFSGIPYAMTVALGLAAIAILSWIGGAIYLGWTGLDPGHASPLTLWRYWRAYGDRAGESIRIALSALTPAALVGLVLLLAPSTQRRHIHGHGRWGSWLDLRRAGLLSDRGLILGESFGGFVRNNSEAHLLVVAPTGGGKTTGVVIPNLLSWTGSVVTLDPKREAWTITAGWRAAHGEAYLWAPLDPHGQTCRFNPLDQIAHDKVRRVVDLMKLAATLIPEPENDTRWIAQSAQRLFRALALWVLDTPRAQKTIGELWRIATTPDDLQAWCHFQAVSRQDLDPACVADLSAFANAVDKERAYILNELQNALQPWSSAAVRAATAASDFRLTDLKTRRLSVYLALDPGDMAAYGKLLRMFFELSADALMRHDTNTKPNHGVLLLIDEFATFGKLPLIERLLAAVRGYGARIMIVCQALSQIDDLYGQTGRNALLGNMTHQIFMPSADPATSGYVSSRLGDTTIETRSRSHPIGLGNGRTSVSTGSGVRTFLKPEEFERMRAGVAVLLVPGASPFRVKIVGWFRNRLLVKRRRHPPKLPILAIDPVSPSFRASTHRPRTQRKTRSRPTSERGQDLFSAPPVQSNQPNGHTAEPDHAAVHPVATNAGTEGANETLRDVDAIESDIGPAENVS